MLLLGCLAGRSSRETHVSRGIWRYGSQLPWRCAETFACFNQRCHGNVAIPPLDNSFCNYADDTPGGHFEMNTGVQTRNRRSGAGDARSSELVGCGQRLGERRRSEQLIQLTGDKWNSAIVTRARVWGYTREIRCLSPSCREKRSP